MGWEAKSLYVSGVPVPQGSLRSFKHPKTGAVVTPQSSKVKQWRDDIAGQARLHAGVWVGEGPVWIEAAFRMPRPKSAPKKALPIVLAAKRPDIDKLARALLDALSGVWFKDDSQVVKMDVSKIVSDPPGVNVTMRWPS